MNKAFITHMLNSTKLLTFSLLIISSLFPRAYSATEVDIETLQELKINIETIKGETSHLESKLFAKQAEYAEQETVIKRIAREQDSQMLEYNVVSKLLELNESYQKILNRLLTKQSETANELRKAKRKLEEKLIDIEEISRRIELKQGQLLSSEAQYDSELSELINTTAISIAAEGIKPYTVNISHEELCGAAETPISCQERAMMVAKRKLADSTGIKITSVSQLEDFELVKDFVISDSSVEIKNLDTTSSFHIKNEQIVNRLTLVGDVIPKGATSMDKYVLIASNIINAKLSEGNVSEVAEVSETVPVMMQERSNRQTEVSVPKTASKTLLPDEKQLTLVGTFPSDDARLPDFVNVEIKDADSIISLMVSDTEITVAQFAQFQHETGYQTESQTESACVIFDYSATLSNSANSDEPGYPISDSHPIVCVSLIDAISYANWLSEKIGETVRLPTIDEWTILSLPTETSQRERSDGMYTNCLFANIRDKSFTNRFGDTSREPCDDGSIHPEPVKQKVPNRLGLYNMYGNVREWTQSCMNENNTKLKFCDDVYIGGSSAYYRLDPNRQSRGGADATGSDLGFRVLVEN
ncbi:hypothetical protein EXU34_00035 [Alteromonas sp. ZYF713]|nr:hypothetical protein [Alteromonas sp. ZYF713]